MRFMMLMIPKGYESDFPPDVQKAASKYPGMQAQSGQRKRS